MNCESKKISELPGITRALPNDIIPIVQDGTNKYITVKDLLGCHHHDTDDCCCSKALSKAITALDFSRTAMDLANKAFDKACQVSTRLAALEEKVNEHDTLICNIQSNITRIFNQLEELGNNLKVSIVISNDEQNVKYKVLQGGRDVETILVPRPTTDFERGDQRPADAAEVLRRLRDFKGEVSKNLTFRAGRFGADDTIHDSEYYNGLNPRVVNIPTRLGHLTDVNASNPSSGDVLYHNGTEWVNVPIAQLIIDNLDCDAVRACIGNFEVAPLVINLDYNNHNVNGTPFVVTTDGAWQIHKLTGSNDFSANIPDDTTQTGNGQFLVTTSTDNTGSSPREATWNVIPQVGTPIEVKIIQAANQPTPTVDRTITYNISGGQTKSIKVNNDVVGNGGQKTAPDGSNYTASLVSNDPGYKIANVTPSAGTYNNGTLIINPITSDVTVQVVLEEIPAGQVTITYTGDTDKVASGLPSGNQTIVSQGDPYTNTITPITGYQFDNIAVSPSGTGDVSTGNISIPQVNANTTIEITASSTSQTSITVNPDNITVPEGVNTTNDDIEVSTDCEGGNINIGTLPTGISAEVRNGHLEITVQDTVSAGTYTFEITDDCDSKPKTITVYVEGQSVNLFENINFGNSKFNAFGVVEERFNNSQPIALNPEVNDPYSANTYVNGSMYYQADLGTWESIHSNIDPSLPINLTQTVADQYQTEPPAGVNKIDWLKDSQQVQARLAAIKDNTNLIYSNQSILQDNMGTDNPNNIIPAEYGQKQGAANERPFYVVIAENTTSITQLSDLWQTHVYVQLWCMPTDFTVTHPDDQVPQAYYIWEDSHHNEQFIGVVWEYQNYKMEHYFKNFRREEYKLHPYYNERYNYDPICNTVYVNGDFYCPISYGGINNNHEDITVSHNPTIAAFTKTTYDNKEFPDYTVIVYDSNNQLVNNIQSQIVSDSGTYCLHVSGFPNIEEQYKIEITATSTGQHPSLTWSYNIYVSDSGAINEPKFGLDNVSQSSALLKYGYTRDGGYYGTRAGNREPGIDGPMYASSTSNLERVGSSCAIRLADINQSSAVITAGTKTTTINSSSFISWGTEENYNTVLNTAFTTHEAMCPPDPLVFKGQKTINGTVTDVIELYIPYVSQNTVITIS